MMKKFLILAVIALLFCTACTAAQEPGYLFDPSFDGQPIDLGLVGCVVSYDDNFMRVTSTDTITEKTNGDPHIIIPVNITDKYEWIKLRIRNLSDATQFEMHFASDASNNAIVAGTCTHFPITAKDADFKEYIFNIKEYNLKSQSTNKDVKLTESLWKGAITQVRFDCMWIAEPSGQVPKGSQMDIDYIAMFDSEESAKSYVPSKADEKVEVEAASEWDKSSPNWIFDNEETINFWSKAGVESSFEVGNMKLVPTTHDPIIGRTLIMDEQFDAEKYKFFAYRYKIASDIGVGGLFFTSSFITELTDKSYSQFTINATGKWTNFVVDMTTYPHENWKGKLNYIRLDPINGGVIDENAEILINRLGFFKTEAEALAFLSEANEGEDYSANTVFSDTLQKAIVPGGTLSVGYKKDDYLMTSTSPAGESNGNLPVVIRTNADGTTEIVALGYTNLYGYTTYVANKKANYSLGYNGKTYVDTKDHWGEEYISFVSARKLFGGTSETEFSPEITMTRGMFITVLGRMHGLDISKYDGNTGYTDVNSGEYYAPYIQWAKAMSIMDGTSATTFAPEEAISRECMAVVIKNYIDNSGFKFTVYGKSDDFNDLSGCDAKTVEAINAVKNVGIINGKGDGKFDPKGISTRAEVATVMQRVIKTILGVNIPAGTKSNEYITRDRIRLGVWDFNHVLATEKGVRELAELGMDLIVHGNATASSPSREITLNYADVYGIEVYVNDYFTHPYDKDFLSKKDPRITSAAYADHPSFAGHYITDEPGSEDMPYLGDVCNDYMKKMPGKRPFINLLPMYANAAQLKYGAGAAAIEYYDADPALYRKHCQEWFKTNDCDYICTDIYPLNWEGTQKTTYGDYIESINQIATVAREEGKEFWCCIQTYGWVDSKRTPNEAEYRWQCYSMLSFGCTGILLWNYLGSATHPSVISPVDYNPTPAYYDCQKVMFEMKDISDVFVQYRNIGAYTHNYSSKYPYMKMSGEYKDFKTISKIECDQPLLIGCFEKKDASGATAFTVVNMSDFATEMPATVELTINDATKKITTYYRGKPVVSSSKDGHITLKLECGDGLLVTVE